MPKQTKHSKNWGGARPGAGRPRTPSTYSAQINVRCTPELVEACRECGGIPVIRKLLEAMVKHYRAAKALAESQGLTLAPEDAPTEAAAIEVFGGAGTLDIMMAEGRIQPALSAAVTASDAFTAAEPPGILGTLSALDAPNAMEAARAGSLELLPASPAQPCLPCIDSTPAVRSVFCAGTVSTVDVGGSTQATAAQGQGQGVFEAAPPPHMYRAHPGFDALNLEGFKRASTAPDPVRVANVEMRVACGFPSPALDYPSEEISLSDLMIRNPAATFFCEARGDSMADAGIDEGDTLIVDRSVEARSGDIVLAYLHGDFTIKRLRIVDGRPELHPENEAADYPVLRPEESDDFSIEGVVTGFCRKLCRAR